jgi:formylglycine-generating enzyme required for sulfatase activity
MKNIILLILLSIATVSFGKSLENASNEVVLLRFFPNFEKDKGEWKIKNIENTFKKVTQTLYFAETETTIEQYNYYLTYLLKNKEYDKLMLSKVGKTDWRSYLPKEYMNLSDATIFENANPDNDYCPVQNIAHAGAKGFCEWLTEWYNSNRWGDTKKFKKVLFRLPTEAEWMNAAHGGKDASFLYPYGNEFRNTKGCFLNNFNCNDENCAECKISKKSESKDGGFFPVRADAYFPNAFLLYQIVGNVAEMLDIQGVAKGGSWEDAPYNCTIQSQKKYTSPSPAIGFRVVMEIIE